MSRTTARLAGVAAAAAVLGLSALPAVAADAPGAATATGWEFAVSNGDTAISPVGTPLHYDSVANPMTSATKPLVGLTTTGRVNVSTGLQYGQAMQTGSAYATQSFVALDAPVTGTVGVPSYTASAGQLRVTCTSNAQGAATGTVDVTNPVPAGLISAKPAANTAIYFNGGHKTGVTKELSDWEMKVVYNEQTTLPNGQLQVVGMHTYYKVASKAGSSMVRGDVKLGIATCGKVTNAPAVEPTPVADPAIAGVSVAALAIAGGAVVLRRRSSQAR